MKNRRDELKIKCYRLIAKIELIEEEREAKDVELHILRALEQINFNAEVRLNKINMEATNE